MTKNKLVIFLAVFISVSFMGCKKTEHKKIRFGCIGLDQMHSPAVMVMKEKKLLEAAGFAVEWVEFLTGAYAMQEMAASSIDFASCGASPIMIAHSQGTALVILAGANEEGSSLVVDNSIHTIKDLEGKRIGTPGTGSIQDTMLAQWARVNKIWIRRVAVQVADMPDLLQKKEIDGFISWAPHPARAVENRDGHELLTSYDMMPHHQCCVLVTRDDILRDDYDTVNKVLEVYLAAYKWFLANHEESIKLMVKTTGMHESVIRKSIRTVHYSNPPYCNTESLHNMANGLIEIGRISIKEEDVEPFLHSLYRPELLEKITGTRQPHH
ncbi:MAG: ABC transporter substrate-binding protein [Treponema sp.]|jgi:NitT/TauT family transport system substrate-binding protein|nr:ABC transporter substrate-binding protein [Treponema sp.]